MRWIEQREKLGTSTTTTSSCLLGHWPLLDAFLTLAKHSVDSHECSHSAPDAPLAGSEGPLRPREHLSIRHTHTHRHAHTLTHPQTEKKKGKSKSTLRHIKQSTERHIVFYEGQARFITLRYFIQILKEIMKIEELKEINLVCSSELWRDGGQGQVYRYMPQ